MGQRRDEAYYQNIALSYYQTKQKFDAIKKQFDERKRTFEDAMLECCDDTNKRTLRFSGSAGETIVVKKVEKTSIEWFPEKLEKRITKATARKVIRKTYRIANWAGMVAYLKELGADPSVFKRFIQSEKVVDEQAIDRLSDTGELAVRDVAGCYLVHSQKPYFTMSVKKGDGDGDN